MALVNRLTCVTSRCIIRRFSLIPLLVARVVAVVLLVPCVMLRIAVATRPTVAVIRLALLPRSSILRPARLAIVDSDRVESVNRLTFVRNLSITSSSFVFTRRTVSTNRLTLLCWAILIAVSKLFVVTRRVM